MINYLLDVSMSHPIAMLPTIINHNNAAINDEFNWIFDSSLNRLTKSVYAPTGSVKSHFGEFVNLSAEYITVKNTDSLSQVITKAVENYTFNADKILYYSPVSETSTALPTILEQIETKINSLSDTVAGISSGAASAPITFGAAPIAAAQSELEIEPVTYPKSHLYATSIQLKRLGVPRLHLTDIQSGNQYTYYTVTDQTSDTVSISDQHTACIQCEIVGKVIDIDFAGEDNSVSEYRILLDRKAKQYVVVKKNPLTCLQLKCAGYSSQYGTQWKIYGYSVLDARGIKLENK